MQDFDNMTDHQLADAIHQLGDEMRNRGNLADKLRADLADLRAGHQATKAGDAWDGLRKLAGEEITWAETQSEKTPDMASFHRGGKAAWVAVLAYMGDAAPAATTEGA